MTKLNNYTVILYPPDRHDSVRRWILPIKIGRFNKYCVALLMNLTYFDSQWNLSITVTLGPTCCAAVLNQKSVGLVEDESLYQDFLSH